MGTKDSETHRDNSRDTLPRGHNSMTAFSRAQSKIDAIAIKQRRARTQAKQGHKDTLTKHPDWGRDASLPTPTFTLLNKQIKEKTEKAQLRVETFERKLHEDG